MSATGWTPPGAGFDRSGKNRRGKAKPNGANGHDPDAQFAPPQGKEPDVIDDHPLPVIPWIDRRLSDWDENELPDRLWVVPDWIPREQVTGIYGPPGVNKTDFLVQLLMALSVGLVFMGYQLERMPVCGFFCEDTEVEIARRAARIAQHYNMYLSEFPDFHYVSLVGHDQLEFVQFDGNLMIESRALKRFDLKIMEEGAGFACLDTAPHFFGGSEIDRRQVSRFLRKLDAISIKRNCGIAITAHPSARGRSSGRMDSGSTGWEGGVRARLALTKADQEVPDDGKPPPDTKDRTLTLWKSNYAAPGKVLDLVCDHGVFTTAALDSERVRARGPDRDVACEERFLELLDAVYKIGGYVNDSVNQPSRYAPAVFAARPDGRGYSRPEYKRAMDRLLSRGQLNYHRNSRYTQIVAVSSKNDTQDISKDA